MSFFFSDRGQSALSDLSSYEAQLNDHLKDLSSLNGRLRDKFELLKSHPETIALAARDLGYFEKGEKIVLLRGLEKGRDAQLNPGKVITHTFQNSFQGNFFWITWITLGLLTYLLSALALKIFPDLGSWLEGRGKNHRI